jgi:hypothetical protein
MNCRKVFLITIILVFLLTGTASADDGAPPPTTFVESPLSPFSTAVKQDYSVYQPTIDAALSSGADRYGYTFDDSVAKSWVDLTTSGTLADFPGTDDEFVGPLPIGFDFAFYENSYSELYISSNGLISFGKSSDHFVNQPIPRDTDPNNVIAPLWDDLVLMVDEYGQSISKVFYLSGSGAGGRYFAVEWFQLARLGSQDELSFEVIIYENGNILLQYNELNGILDQATVGIEDEHGVDGLLYLHNAAGLSVSKAIKFTRPASAWRAKVYPTYRSSIIDTRQAHLDFIVRNSGNLQSDVYDLTYSTVSPGWQVSFSSGDSGVQLQDTDGDGAVDTGSLAPHADFPVLVNVFAPENSKVGDYITFTITAKSSKDAAKTAEIDLQVAVPAPFAQAFLDMEIGPSLNLVWKENQFATNLNQGQQFTGSNLSVVALPDKRYIYTWEHNVTDNVSGRSNTNLEYIIMSQFGVVLKSVAELTHNDQAEVKTEDRFLSLSGTPDGRIGAIWIRSMSKKVDGVHKSNYNVYYAVLSNAGQMVVSPINLTNNSAWRGTDDYDIPVFISPRIAVTEDNHVLLTWGDERNHLAGSSADLYFAVYDLNGSVLNAPAALTASIPGDLRYTTPALVALTGNRALMAYIVMDSGNPIDPFDDVLTTAYRVMNSTGGTVKAHALISGSAGSTPDGIQFASGAVFLAWHVVGGSQIEYVLLDGVNLSPLSGPQRLSTPKGREPGVVSVTGDGFERAILTWGDAEQSDYLCYTLIDSQGVVETPPMIFASGLGDQPLINTNSYGLGNAVYDGSWKALLPLSMLAQN